MKTKKQKRSAGDCSSATKAEKAKELALKHLNHARELVHPAALNAKESEEWDGHPSADLITCFATCNGSGWLSPWP